MYARNVLFLRCGHLASGRTTLTCATLALLWITLVAVQAGELGEVDLTVLDAKTKEPIGARLRIFDSRGRAPRIRNVPRLENDFSFQNMLTFKLKTGRYQFTIDRGPHYQQRRGHLEVNRDGFDQKTVTLPRFVDMRGEGYYSGDLLLSRDREAVDVLMDVEELDYVAWPSWEPGVEFTEMAAKRDRSVRLRKLTDDAASEVVQDFSAAYIDTSAGRYLVANLDAAIVPLHYPTDPLGFAATVKSAQGAHLAVLDPWAWDMPMLVAHGMVDSIAIFNDALQLDGDQNKIKHGRPPTQARFQQQHGAGRYAESIYFHLLNCGLRIPPSAFSNSGESDNPPGFNRVYVACGHDFSIDSWWQGLTAGQSIVSNGPVLRVRANEQLPGTVFKAEKELQIEITCELATRQKVEYLEIIKNGRALESVRLDKWAAAGGHLPIVTFKESGWLLVRAYAPTEPNYRCAISAPFFVEIDRQPCVAPASAKYFKDWVFERAKLLRKSGLPKEELRQRLQQQKTAYDFWQQLEQNGR